MILLYRIVRNPKAGRGGQDAFEYPALEEDRMPGADGAPETQEQNMDGHMSILGESLVQAERILDTARREARQIKEEAREEGLTAGREQGYREGFLKGLEEGRNTYTRRIVELEEQIKDYLEDVQIEKEKLLEKYMDDLKEISLVIGEKIVRTSLRTNSQVIERMILAATEKLKKTAWAKIYIGSAQDTAMDIQADPKFLQELSNLSDNVKVIIMEGKEAGTCIVEMPDEIIDLSVGTQLENIREIMNNARL